MSRMGSLNTLLSHRPAYQCVRCALLDLLMRHSERDMLSFERCEMQYKEPVRKPAFRFGSEISVLWTPVWG